MTDRELLQQALDWADNHGEVVFAGGGWNAVNPMNEWTRKVRARLSQCDRCGEVNPAEIHTCSPNYVDRRQWKYDPLTGESVAKYSDIISDGGLDPRRKFDVAPQREWQGLTDEERNDCLVGADPCEALLEHEAWQLMQDIEDKLKEKNT